jgi:pimeloyl-ACP methyl ester carboxylesterase
MFEGFTTARLATAGAKIHLRQGGKGRPLLLLHGYPGTHVMWHKIVTCLARRFTVVASALLVLWGGKGVVDRLCGSLALWREKAVEVTGRVVRCGHFIPEEAPEEPLAALAAFLAG